MTLGQVGRADLLRMAATASDEDLRRLAELAGFQVDPAHVQLEDDGRTAALQRDVERDSELAFKQAPLIETPFFHASRFKLYAPKEAGPYSQTRTRSGGYAGWRARPAATAGFHPLLPWAELVPVLRDLLAVPAPSRRIDAPRAVERIARSDTLERLPMRSRRSWPSKLVVVVDRSTHLVPFWQDQDLVGAALARFLPHTVIETVYFDDQDGRFKRQGHILASPKDIPAMAPDVLVIGDLGALAQGGTGRQAWDRLGAAIVPGRARVLSPVPLSWLPTGAAKVWRARPWGTTASIRTKAQTTADDLLSLLSPLVRIEPNLLRQVRIRTFPSSGAEVEALAWRHGAMEIRLEDAGQLRPQAMQRRRKNFGQIDEKARLAMVEVWRAFRGDLHEAVYFEELLELDPEMRALLPETDIEDAEAFFAMMARQAAHKKDNYSARLWCRRMAERFVRLQDNPDASALIWNVKKDDPAFAALDPGSVPVPDAPPVSYAVLQRGDHAIFTTDSQHANSSLLGAITSHDGLVRIDGLTSSEPETLPRINPPQPLPGGGMTPAMIVVSAGSFMMGSRETEADRFDDEGPQQEITFDQPFALARYPVTFDEYDGFCDATRREKPGDEGWGRGKRPVINVSWHDATAYCAWLAEQTGEPYRLPSEAEWEYACRAGTTTAFHWGDLWNPGMANGGSALQKTTEVGSYEANPWGFHDMHGTTYEWCADVWNGSHEGAAADGSARQVSQQASVSPRVLRGGSWLGFARYCRSACRDGYAPDSRNDSLGFRPARGQVMGNQAVGNAERSGAGGGKAGVAEPPVGRSPRPTPGLWPGVVSEPLARLRVLSGREATLDLRTLPDAPFVIRTDRAELVIQRTTLSDLSWASGMGRDRFGLWTEFALDDLRPRLRFCPPGRFTMGSPDDEAGRHVDEGPLTEVTFETGFWMFETPVTQDLYATVMRDVVELDEAPSRFNSRRRPVDSVSWDDAQAFLLTINHRLRGLDLHLPSEAAWEYACRAGTQTATYAGSLEIAGDNNAPVLDDIAWYGGNSGNDFDLDDGHDSSEWPEKQYSHRLAGTREVGLKRPNPWGMLDMLGNVLEWCDDVWTDNHEGANADGRPRQVSQQAGETYRVLRGGSWLDGARYCRSAYRFRDAPDGRGADFGFRPARGQLGAQACGNAERSLPVSGKAGVAEPPVGRIPESGGGGRGAPPGLVRGGGARAWAPPGGAPPPPPRLDFAQSAGERRMKVDIFTIPVLSQAEAAAELNRHLSSVRVLSVDRQFVSDGANSFWTLCVLSDTAPARSDKSPSTRRGSVDYRDILSAEEFALYARLRDLRKQLADRDGVPPYAVFTNEQLAAIVQSRASSLTRLKDIDGIGDARIGKYGAAVVGLLSAAPSAQVGAAVEP